MSTTRSDSAPSINPLGKAPASGTTTDSNAKIADSKPGFFSFSNLKSLAILVVVIFALRHTVASPYHVPTASMEPTIKVGDRLLAYKLAYNLKFPFTEWVLAEWGAPTRGDIIVFRYPRDPDIDYVKRVVAVAGDRVQVIDDILYVNGEAQARKDASDEVAILDDIEDVKDIKHLFRENLFGIDHLVMQNIPSQKRFMRPSWPVDGQAFVVPPNSVFCMGDNRDNSTDSRVWGHVPLEYVRGKALFVIWSLYNSPGSALPSIRIARFGRWLY